MSRMALLCTLLACLLTAGSARAAGPGEVFLTGGLDLPPGAIAGGHGGYFDGDPTELAISGNGRYVAFAAGADALSSEANLDVDNVFRKDRVTGDVVLVSRATGAGGAVAALGGRDVSISDDGNRVAWVTGAALDPADVDGVNDVYVRDIATATTILATPGTAAATGDYGLSGNGAFVAFATSTALAGADDTNGASDVYRRRLSDGATALVSDDAAAGIEAANAASSDPGISDDGRWVAFVTAATNIVAGGGAPSNDVVARDMTAGAFLVSNQSGALGTGANGGSRDPHVAGAPVAANTVTVAYNSDATNAAPVGQDTSAAESVYRRRLVDNSSTLVSRATGAGGANASSRAHVGGISDNGLIVAFASDAGNLGAGADYYGVYVRDVFNGTTILGSVDNAYAVEPALSGDGAVVAWLNGAGGITSDSDRDLIGVFARALPGGAAEYMSRPPGPAPFLAPATATESGDPGMRVLSADGRYAVFTGYSTRLPGNESGTRQVYRRDTLTGALELVSRTEGGAPADGSSQDPSISADGTRVAFSSFARLVAADTDDAQSVYMRDLAAGTTTLVSRADGPDGALPDLGAFGPRISAGGRHVGFLSEATNLGGGAGNTHVYLRDVGAGSTQLIDRATDGTIGNDDADGISVSRDGRLVAFSTRSNNLDPADPAPGILRDVYVRDTVAGTTVLVSRRSGHDGAKAIGSSFDPVLSSDGRIVVFIAGDEALATEAGGWGGNDQLVVRDLATGQNTLGSRAASGAPAGDDAEDPSVNGDGSVVAFASTATNLLPGVGGGNRHGVFARTMATGALSGPPAFGLAGDNLQNRAVLPSLSDDGQCMAFHAFGHNQFTGAAGDFRTDYIYVISGSCPKPLPPGGPQPGPGVTPSKKPSITDASMQRKRFRVGRKPTKRRVLASAKAGTAFRFRLSDAADVTITIQRRTAGRRSGGSCRKPSHKLRKRPACARYVKRGALVRGGLAARRHSVAFSGRIGSKALKPGRYRGVLVARNDGGKSKPVKLSFRVVKR